MDKFPIDAPKRKVIKTLQILGNCSNIRTYTYTQDQVKIIFKAIKDEIRIQEQKFIDGIRKQSVKEFNL